MITSLLQPKLTFETAGHEYRYSGSPVLSFSQIMDCVGVRKSKADYFQSLSGSEWYGDDEASVRGRELGTALHSYAAIRLRGGQPDYDPALQPWVDGWEQWRAFSLELEVYKGLVEQIMYCSTLRYCGTPDAVMQDRNGKMWIVDWKSASVFNPRWWIQIGAYSIILKRDILGGRQPLGGMIVHITEGKHSVYTKSPTLVGTYENKWMSILNTYREGAE